MTPIAVVGGGLLGRLLSWQLLERGHPVTLFEKDAFEAPRSAAHTAAAMIAPLSEVVGAEKILHQWGMESLQLWPLWLEQLGTPVAYSAPGSLVVAHAQDHNALLQFKQDLQQQLVEQDDSQWLGSVQLRKREPALEHFQQALYLPAEAYLHQRQLLAALLQRVQQLGGECVAKTAATIADKEVITAAGRYSFPLILDCRGMGAKEDLAGLRGVRGEVLWIETRDVQFQHPIRLMHPRYKIYLVPKGEGRYMIGATEIESNDHSPISLQSNLELSSALYTIHPALAEARIIESDTNVRPAMPDNLPVLKQTGSVLSINGLYRHGYLLAPVVVNQAMEKIQHFLENL